MPKNEDIVVPACLPKSFSCRGAYPLRIFLKIPANRRYCFHRQPAAGQPLILFVINICSIYMVGAFLPHAANAPALGSWTAGPHDSQRS